MIIIDSLKNFYEEHEKGCEMALNVLKIAVAAGVGFYIGKKMYKGAVDQFSQDILNVADKIRNDLESGNIVYYDIYQSSDVDLTDMVGCAILEKRVAEVKPEGLTFNKYNIAGDNTVTN